MSQTFSNWNEVPKAVHDKIVKIWNGCGTATSFNSVDTNKKQIVVYKLKDYKVGLNLDFMTNEQKIAIFNIVATKDIRLSDFLLTLSFDIDCIRVHDEVYHLPGIIMGIWPHCDLFGGMDETGNIHT